MTYQELDNLLGLTNLTDFANQLTIRGCQISVLYQVEGTLLLSEDDKWKYWGLNWIWNIWGKLEDWARILKGNLNDIWTWIIGIKDYLWNMIGRGWRSWWDEIWETIRRMYYNFSYEFFRFTQDPWGYLYRVIQNAVSPLISGIKAVGIDIWDFVSKVRNAVSEVVSSWVTSAQNVIVNWITDRINAVYNWIKDTKEWLSKEVWLAVKTIQFLPGEIFSTVRNLSDEAISQIKVATSSVLKTFDFGLGGLADAFHKAISGIFGNFWDWFKGSIMNFWNFVNTGFLIPLKAGSEEVMKWLWGQIQEIISTITDAAKKMIPRAPEQGASMIWEGLGFLGMGAGVLALMTLGGGLAKRVSGADIPGLGAIIADFSGFKYITGAVMGGLVTAAYAQPLKYYYNALFKPWLPSWMDAQMALGRSKISPELFKFFQKYAGIDEKYYPIYKALAARPISAFMIRYIADAEITDPAGIFEICMDNGYSIEHSIYMAFAMSWGANSSYRKAVEFALQKCFREGFISRPGLDKEFDKIRTAKEVPASYTTVDGYTYRATIKAPLDQKTLIAMAQEWEAFYDSMLDKVSALKTAYGKETIIESELRSGLAGLGIVTNRIEDIVAREKAKKKGKVEPDKGKDLRKELKSVLTRCLKEGFITVDEFQKQLGLSNQLVDEATLIKERAWWESFYDDTDDFVEIYKKSLANGLITEAEFRRDFIDRGLRPDKIELMIEHDRITKLGRAK